MTINPKDQRTCIDLDECKEWGYCDQLCTNTPSSYKCSCANGYTLVPPRHCKADNSKDQTINCFFQNQIMYYFIFLDHIGTDMRLIFAHHSTIYKTDSQGASLEAITNTTAVSGVDFHFGKKLLFWSDVETRKVINQIIIVKLLLSNCYCQIFIVKFHNINIVKFLNICVVKLLNRFQNIY